MSTKPIAIIGGTGFGDGVVPGKPDVCVTEFGSVEYVRTSVGPVDNAIMLARHGKGHRLPPHLINHRANIAALRDLKVQAIFATAAVGSLKMGYRPGDFVVVDDFLDFSNGGPLTFYETPGTVCHTDMSCPFDARLRMALLTTAPENRIEGVHRSGTYLCVSGPRYETPAEVRLYASLGADVVGMTVAPEVILSREAGIPYAAVGLVTNYGTGLAGPVPLSHSDVEYSVAESRVILSSWLLRAAHYLESA